MARSGPDDSARGATNCCPSRREQRLTATATQDEREHAEREARVCRAQRTGIAATAATARDVIVVARIRTANSVVRDLRRERRADDAGERDVIDRPTRRSRPFIGSDAEPDAERLASERIAE